MKTKLFLLFFAVCQLAWSQLDTYEKGKIIDNILIKAKPSETFQLYLPKSFDPAQNSAVIFVFDPSGNGRNGLKPFMDGAEAYNYILVCSNNSKNGPYDKNFDIANRLFAQVLSELKTDPKQIYTAGFSGGSRLATTIAALTNSIQGVIGCGAGFVVNMAEIEHPNSSSYVGLVGDEDMNFHEMFRFMDWLGTYHIDHELLTFQGGHRWPPQTQISRALGWLELQAYKKGIRPINKNITSELYHDNYKLADSLENEGQHVLAVLEYERLLNNYRPYYELDSISKKVDALKATEIYKTEVESRQMIAKLEKTISDKFVARFEEESIIGKSKDNFHWWKKELKLLDENYKDSTNYFALKMWKRLRYSLMAMAYESSTVYQNNNRLNQEIYCNKLMTVMVPKQPFYHIRLARSYAKSDDLTNTVQSLKDALEVGYEDKEYIRSAKEFSKFKGKKKFDKFLDSITN